MTTEVFHMTTFQRGGYYTIAFLLANLLFWYTFERKSRFVLRFLSASLILHALMSATFYLTRGTIYSDIASFVIVLIYTLEMARFCFQISIADAAFCATAAYSTQFLGSLTSEFIHRSFGISRWPLEYFVIVVVYGIVYIIFGRQMKKSHNLELNRLWQFFLLTAAALTEILICSMLRHAWLLPENRALMHCTMLLLFICSVGILTLQFTLLSRKNLATELEVVNELLKKEQQQYRISKETIDSINRKCHDMRHQIRTIGTEARIHPDAIRDIAHVVNIYDSLYQTGSPALDLLLTEKDLYCREHRIRIHCMADGKKLSFLSDTDLYSLFGNMLENAIQAVLKLPEEDREIGLTVAPQGNLVSISVRNPYMGDISFENGIPVTQNTDSANHGIGTRSIQVIVRKYGGTVNFEAENGEFRVMILFT